MTRERKRSRNLASRAPSWEAPSDHDEPRFGRPSRAKANLYDAVAGRVTAGGLVGNITDSKASRQPLRPDEVLFKQKNAPIRYEETDYYFAHEKLPADQRLPSSDLLSALHAYVSKLYSRTAGPETEKAWKCMDETALIAFGILLEESAREMMGETGDLAFTEGADVDEERALSSEGQDEHDEDDDVSGKTTGVPGSDSMSSSGDEDTSDDST